MSEKPKKKNPKPSGKGKGNQDTKRRRQHKDQKQESQQRSSKGETKETSQKEAPLENQVDPTPETHPEVVESDTLENAELFTEPSEITVSDDLESDKRDATSSKGTENLQNESSIAPHEESTAIQEGTESASSSVDDPSISSIQTTAENPEGSLGDSLEQSLDSDPEVAFSQDQISEDIPQTRVGKVVKSRISKFGSPMDLNRYLLPEEQVLASKMVIYFGEGQIFLGFFILLMAFVLQAFYQILGLSIVIGLIGSLLITTGYASEELHVTNIRILVRRMNWVDRLFRIPRDSQYILDEIVSFDIQRAPINRALFISGLLPLFLFIIPEIRGSTSITVIIFVIVILALAFSQRLGKRTLSFSMSGGHQIHLGQYKGIPTDVVDQFIQIIMEKNVFESDSY